MMATPFLRWLKLPATISSQLVQAEKLPCCIQLHRLPAVRWQVAASRGS